LTGTQEAMDFKGEFKEEIGVGKRAGYVD